MTPTELHEQLDTLITENIRHPAFVWGPPGVGKSSIVRDVAAAHDLPVIDLRLGQIPPADLRGLPMVEDGVACYARPQWLRPSIRVVTWPLSPGTPIGASGCGD
jgi:MoxR-like ATPase